jgi:hypothetical protein
MKENQNLENDVEWLIMSRDLVDNVKVLLYEFATPDMHFDYLGHFSGTKADKFGNSKKRKLWNYKQPEKTTTNKHSIVQSYG